MHSLTYALPHVVSRRAIDTIDYCLRDDLAYCVDVPMQFKNPSQVCCGV